jgi:hypothetical protein
MRVYPQIGRVPSLDPLFSINTRVFDERVFDIKGFAHITCTSMAIE